MMFFTANYQPLKELASKEPLIASELCRLFIAHNILTSLNRMFKSKIETKGHGTRPELEVADRNTHFFLTAGVLKEGLDAYRVLSSQNCLNRMKKLWEDKEAQDLRASLENESDKDNPDSLYSKFLRSTRDDAAFHWSRKKIGQYLDDLGKVVEGEEQVKLVVGYSEKAVDFTFPIADKILFRLGEWPSDRPDIEVLVDKVGKCSVDFRQFVARLAKWLIDCNGTIQ